MKLPAAARRAGGWLTGRITFAPTRLAAIIFAAVILAGNEISSLLHRVMPRIPAPVRYGLTVADGILIGVAAGGLAVLLFRAWRRRRRGAA